MFSTAPQGVTQRLGELRIIKNPDLVSTQVRGHATSITGRRQRAFDQQAIVTGNNADGFVGMSVHQ